MGCIFQPQRRPCGRHVGVRRKNLVMLGWSAAVLLCQFLVHFRPFSALSSGVRYWRYRPDGLVILVLIISMWSGPLVGCCIMGSLSQPLPLVKDEDLIAVFQQMIQALGLDTVGGSLRMGSVRRHQPQGVMDARRACSMLGCLAAKNPSAASVHGCGFPGFCQS